ncbi:Clp protease-domain-containing protein [Lipomyces oligophaga]|uniref:Clp protease-domain-containing protein n=1 Tax=Lipomyces oligophaga TaxID=45792 RepID=UPI0034CDA3BC
MLKTGLVRVSRLLGYSASVRLSKIPCSPKVIGQRRGYFEVPESITIPTVPSQEKDGRTVYFDIFSRLLKERIVMLHGSINSSLSAIIVSQLLYLEAMDPSKPIYMYVNSPGGEMHAGFSIIDTMHYIKCPVSTICVGIAGSMASLVLVSGERGMRHALPNAWIMVHQPSTGMSGKASDLAIQARQILRMREQANKIYQSRLNKSYLISEIEKMVENDNFLDAEEALDIGIIDSVIKPDPGSGHNGPETSPTSPPTTSPPGGEISHGSGGLREAESTAPDSTLPPAPLPQPAIDPESPKNKSPLMTTFQRKSTGPGIANLPENWWREMFSV